MADLAGVSPSAPRAGPGGFPLGGAGAASPYRTAGSASDQLRDEVTRLFIPPAIWVRDWRLPHIDADGLARFETLAKQFNSPHEICELIPQLPGLQNFATNVWEFAHGKTALTSYPWNVSIPVADLCNARCTFCTSWLHGRAILDLETLERFEPVLRRALFVGLVGHGEPLAHPRFDELCDRLAEMLDPLASGYTITNGFFLDKWFDRLNRINLDSYTISLHAATPETHDEVMGMGREAFPRIIESIERLTKLRSVGRAGDPPPHDYDGDYPADADPITRLVAIKRSGKRKNVYLTFVVTQQNLAEIPAFIELGNRLGVTEIYLRALAAQSWITPGLNYHLLPAYRHPDFELLRERAVAAIRQSQVPVQAEPHVWGQPVFPAALEERFRTDPPPTVSRAQALRDRDLRHSNEHVYHEQKGIYRGQPIDPDQFSVMKWANGRVEVMTAKPPGSFAASVGVTYSGEGERALRVEVDAACEEGAIGLGLHDEEKGAWDQWLCPHVIVPAGSSRTAVLETVTATSRIRLVVFNGADGAGASKGSIGAATIGEAGGGDALPFDWATLSGHNAADLLDDGSNPLGREPRFACKSVYYNFFLNEFYYRMVPCCYLSQVPGFSEIRFDGELPFAEAWNSPAMTELRRRLVAGPLYGACKRCPEKW